MAIYVKYTKRKKKKDELIDFVQLFQQEIEHLSLELQQYWLHIESVRLRNCTQAIRHKKHGSIKKNCYTQGFLLETIADELENLALQIKQESSFVSPISPSKKQSSLQF